MNTFIPADYKPLVTSSKDLQLACATLGFTVGFGFLTTWKAARQTADVYRRYGLKKLNSPYIWMVWLEILVCVIFAVLCYLHLNNIIPPSFAFYFVILTSWALQVQLLLQIIINRVAILLADRRQALRLKVTVAVLITIINVSVYCIWLPARLQISAEYERINNIWDRCEKTIYLVIDAALNFYFVRTVKNKLVSQGLVKYDRLVTFNMAIIGFSLSMDVLIIGMMSLKNSFVYMQFHPLAYIVKLNIEMSMADLIAKVARTNHNNPSGSSRSRDAQPLAAEPDKPKPTKQYPESNASSDIELNGIIMHRLDALEVNMKHEVQVQIERRSSVVDSTRADGGGSDAGNIGITGHLEEDTKPLKQEDMERDAKERAKRLGLEKGHGVQTTVWTKR